MGKVTKWNDLAIFEFWVIDQLFLKPGKQATEDYITGRFG